MTSTSELPVVPDLQPQNENDNLGEPVGFKDDYLNMVENTELETPSEVHSENAEKNKSISEDSENSTKNKNSKISSSSSERIKLGIGLKNIFLRFLFLGIS